MTRNRAAVELAIEEGTEEASNFKVDKVDMRQNESFVSVGQREETKGCDLCL